MGLVDRSCFSNVVKYSCMYYGSQTSNYILLLNILYEYQDIKLYTAIKHIMSIKISNQKSFG